MAKLTSEPPVVITYKLELSEMELKVLFSLLSKVNGDPNNSYRKFTKPIFDAIKNYTRWCCVDKEFIDMFTQRPHAGEIK